MSLLLRNLRWWSQGEDGAGDLRIRGGRIAELGRGLRPARRERALDLDGCLVLPGLINAHDHLQLDLLPHLGQPPYRSFYDWAEAIHQPERTPLRELARARLRDRLLWGGLRNLISGATTVAHHDPGHWSLRRGFPVKTLDLAWSHSLGFATDLARDHRRSRGRPYVIHAAEGIDERARREVAQLEALGVLGPDTVLVHGIAISPEDGVRLGRAGVGLVWCPASNLRLYGATAPVAALHRLQPVGIGTDSTISGSATLLDELRVARETAMVADETLLRMVTDGAARLFRVRDGRGTLAVGAPADLLLLGPRNQAATPAEQLFQATTADVESVLVAGRPRLATQALAAQLELGDANAVLGDSGAPRWLAYDLGALRRRLERAIGEPVLREHPLWRLMTVPAQRRIGEPAPSLVS